MYQKANNITNIQQEEQKKKNNVFIRDHSPTSHGRLCPSPNVLHST